MDCIQQFAEVANLLVLKLDNEGRLVWLSPRAASFLNLSSELQDVSFQQVCRQQGIPFPALFQPGCKVDKVIEHDACFLDTHGELKFCHWTIATIESEQSALGYWVYLEDKTKEFLERKASRQKQTQIDQLIQHLPGLLCIKDLNGKYLACNQQYLDLLGLSYEQLIGNYDYNLISQQATLSLLASNTDSEITIRIAEQIRTFTLHEQSLLDSNKQPYAILQYYNDITSYKQITKELSTAKSSIEKESQEQSLFLANMRHDLKTPLHSLLGMAELLKFKEHTTEQEEYITGILHTGNQILKIIDDILTYTKVEAGKVHFHLQEFNLKELVEGVIEVFAGQAAEKNVQVIVSYCDNVPSIIKSDPHAIRRILINLMSNAVKFTKKGYIYLAVDNISQDEKNVQLQISIEDTGIGINRNQLDQVFVEFYRGEPAYRSQHNGTGLGLTVAKQLAEDLGGSLRVHSNEGAGSTFYCSLPVGHVSQIEEPVSLWQRYGANLKVLIVDDLAIRAVAMRKQLNTDKVDVASSIEALSKLIIAHEHNDPYNMVLIDEGLEGVGLTSLLNKINAHPGLASLLKVVFTQDNSLEYQQNLIQLGVTRQLTKPVQPSELEEELVSIWQQWLRNQNLSPLADVSRTKLKVLLLEDNLFSQRATIIMLKALNCTIEIANSGQEALEKLNESFDIVFVDLGLPDMDGMEFAKLVRRSENSTLRHMYICALTAHAGENERRQCMQAGMDYFLAKPAKLEDFKQVLGKVAQGRTFNSVMRVG